jgi:hypothetical protein
MVGRHDLRGRESVRHPNQVRPLPLLILAVAFMAFTGNCTGAAHSAGALAFLSLATPFPWLLLGAVWVAVKSGD